MDVDRGDVNENAHPSKSGEGYDMMLTIGSRENILLKIGNHNLAASKTSANSNIFKQGF